LGGRALIITFSTAPFKRSEKSVPIKGFGSGLLRRKAGCTVALTLSLR
jgi:hypothetical protein